MSYNNKPRLPRLDDYEMIGGAQSLNVRFFDWNDRAYFANRLDNKFRSLDKKLLGEFVMSINRSRSILRRPQLKDEPHPADLNVFVHWENDSFSASEEVPEDEHERIVWNNLKNDIAGYIYTGQKPDEYTNNLKEGKYTGKPVIVFIVRTVGLNEKDEWFKKKKNLTAIQPILSKWLQPEDAQFIKTVTKGNIFNIEFDKTKDIDSATVSPLDTDFNTKNMATFFAPFKEAFDAKNKLAGGHWDDFDVNTETATAMVRKCFLSRL
jgi:hypothetical protein